jgi:biotin carboxylase
MKTKIKFFWVIGGGLLQIPLIEEIKKLGYKVIVSDKNRNCVCSKRADVFFEIDIYDIPKHLEIACEFEKSKGKIVGVLAAGIDAPETMAVLAKELGLPSVEPEIAHIVNNKDKFRNILEKLNYPVPKFKVISKNNLKDLKKIIKEIGFPLIIKSSNSSGSRGSRIFRYPNLKEIRKTVKLAMNYSRSSLAMIEKCWDGSEHTVETIFDINGNFHPCFITDRTFDKKNGYPLEIGLEHPSSLSKKHQLQMYQLAEKVAIDLGIRIGAAKYDMMLTEDGPRILEMTCRLSGGFDSQYLVPAATGKNVLKTAILISLGKPFPKNLLIDKKHKVGVTSSVWPNPGKISSIKGLDKAKKISGYENIFFRYTKGDVVEPYVDSTKRVCCIIATGRTINEAKKSLDKIKKTIQIKTI